MRSMLSPRRLADRLRAECARRQWDLSQLADHAGISRTTLYHLLEGHTSRPHGTTLNALAEALEIPVGELLALASGEPVAPRDCLFESSAFDRATNPEVDAVARERPQLFAHWDEADWDELYSSFGTGGALSSSGVVTAAESINRKRETVRRLHIVLETHLRVVAEELVDTLYRMVRPQSNLASGEALRSLLAESTRGAVAETHHSERTASEPNVTA